MNLFTIKDCLEIFIYRKPEQKLPIKLSVFVMSPNNCIHAKKSRKSKELTQTPINDHPHPSILKTSLAWFCPMPAGTLPDSPPAVISRTPWAKDSLQSAVWMGSLCFGEADSCTVIIHIVQIALTAPLLFTNIDINDE